MVLSTPIPLDIITQIIDEVPFNLKFLKASCTVSHTFASACQCRLFETVEIGSWRGQGRCQQLYKLLASSPHLARFIRNLTLQNGWHRMPRPSGGYEKVEWLLVERTLASVLDMLPALRSINLKSSSRALDWNTLSCELRTSFLRVFGLPSLTRLRFSHVVVPASVLATCANLVELYLYHSEIVDEAVKQSSLCRSQDKRPSIRCLSVTGRVPSRVMLESVLDITHLKEFRLVDPNDRNTGSELTKCFAPSLEHFIWTFNDASHHTASFHDMYKSPFSFSCNLRSLEIRLEGPPDFIQLDYLWSTLCALKDLGTGPVGLEEFIVRVRYMECFAKLVTQNTWDALDAILAERSVFANLRRARIVFYDTVTHDDALQLLMYTTPGLWKLGLVSIEDACRPWPTSNEGWEFNVGA